MTDDELVGYGFQHAGEYKMVRDAAIDVRVHRGLMRTIRIKAGAYCEKWKGLDGLIHYNLQWETNSVDGYEVHKEGFGTFNPGTIEKDLNPILTVTQMHRKAV